MAKKKLTYPSKKARSLRLCQRPERISIPDAVITEPRTAALAFRDIVVGTRMAPPHVENLVVLFMDAQGNLINYYRTEGGINYAAVYHRQILEAGLNCGAVSAVSVHNHPSGSIIFSADDLKSSGKLISTLQVADITLQDVIAVAIRTNGEMEYASMRENDIPFNDA